MDVSFAKGGRGYEKNYIKIITALDDWKPYDGLRCTGLPRGNRSLHAQTVFDPSVP